MSNTSLTASIKEWAEPFGGVSLTNSTMPLVQLQWIDGTPEQDIALDPVFNWLSPSENATGAGEVQIFAFATGCNPATIPEVARKRIASLFILSHLHDANVVEAFDYLKDMFFWQMQTLTSMQPPLDYKETHPAHGLVDVPRAEFTFD